VYLDEQPITSIQGALDMHVYDIERVEALAGPQGTLYGASSEAGTVRIITNKPDSPLQGRLRFTGDTVRGQGGYVARASSTCRSPQRRDPLGWLAEHDAGYIDNIRVISPTRPPESARQHQPGTSGV